MADLLPDHDESEGNLPTPPPRRRGRWWKIGCGGVLAIMLVIVGSWLIWRSQKLSAIAEIEAEIRARGEPVNAEELNEQFHDLQGAKDKTALFLAIIRQVDAESLKEEMRPLPIVGDGEPLAVDPETPWEQEAAVAAFLAKHTELLDEIEAAVNAEGEVRFPYDFGENVFVRTDKTQSLRICARLLLMRASFAAQTGDSEQSFRSARALVGLAESLRDEPLAISMLVHVALREVATSTIADLLPVSGWTEKQLAQLRDDCLASDWRASTQTAIIGERAVGRIAFQDPGAFAFWETRVAYITGSEDERFFLQYMTDCAVAMDQTFPENLSDVAQIQTEFENVLDTTSYAVCMTHIISSLTTMSIEIMANAGARALANDRSNAAQLAIELYRREHGKLPAELSDLVPDFLDEVPIDPFTGDPLIYRVDEDAIVIYSVGRNGVDDGGVVNKEGEPLDHVVRVLRK